MTDSVADRVREQASFAGGTGAVTLTGTAVAGFQSFLSGWGASGTGDYCLVMGSQWEVGFGTLNAGGTTLTRTTVYGSYSGGTFTAGTACTFSSGTLDCLGVIPAELAHYLNTREITVASASTCDIGAAQGSNVVVSGAVTITSFGTKKNRRRFVRFSGALTLTYNATSLILPGAGDIATVAGDTLIAQSDSSGNWRVVQYTRGGQSPISQIARRANGLTPHENLKITRASNSTLAVTADAIVLFDSSGNAKRYTGLSETLDIGGSVGTANSLDTGTEASGTWYYAHAIGKTDGTLDTILSVSSTAPTLPSGYAFSGLLGAVRNDGSSNFVDFGQLGNKVTQKSTSVLTNGTSTTYTAPTISATVPPNARSIRLRAGVNTSSGTAPVAIFVTSNSSGGTTAIYGEHFVQQTTGDSSNKIWGYVEIVMITAQQILYYVTGTNAQGSIDIEGWDF